MNERKYWSTFYDSGRIEDYLSYKSSSSMLMEAETPNQEQTQLGAVNVERFCACDGHGTENKQSG